MNNKLKKITAKTLEKWNACHEGYTRFNELFPKGADLRTASDGLIADGNSAWSDWLWSHCKNSGDDKYIIQCTATAGYKGTATAGDEGIIIITYWDGNKFKRKMSFVGQDCELKPNVAYKLDEEFNFVEVQS